MLYSNSPRLTPPKLTAEFLEDSFAYAAGFQVYLYPIFTSFLLVAEPN